VEENSVPGKPTRRSADGGQNGTEAVDAFMRDLDHKLKPEVEALRKLILAADSRIGEGIKRNAPSFQHQGQGGRISGDREAVDPADVMQRSRA